jgi:hypothetical protein
MLSTKAAALPAGYIGPSLLPISEERSPRNDEILPFIRYIESNGGFDA